MTETTDLEKLHDRQRIRLVAETLRKRAERAERRISAAIAEGLSTHGHNGYTAARAREEVLEAVEFEIADALGVPVRDLRDDVF